MHNAHPPPLDRDRIQPLLGSWASRFSLELVDECASTSSVLRDDPPPDDGRVHVLACERQTGGRGRRGRQWLSWPGASLTFSMLWRFPAGSPAPAGLSLAAGVALARTLENCGARGIRLKWPNDVLADERKLAGILVELVSGPGAGVAAVIGVGINCALPDEAGFPEGLEVAALDRILAAPPDRNRLLALLLVEAAGLFETYTAAGFEALRGAWEQRNAHAGRQVRISGEGLEVEGRCLGVDADGALLVATEDGVRRMLSGEVSLRPAD